jgi:aminopeptidase N
MKTIFFKYTIFSIMLLVCQKTAAQNVDQNKDDLSPYRVTALKINDLINTKLEVSFDYGKRYLYGKEWLTLKPHFYETDTLTLDAKGMDFKEIALMEGKKKNPLHYTYDAEQLFITLNRKYRNTEQYTIYIDYTAKPDELKTKGGVAIKDTKGLYFINPDGNEDKPIQIWTQGETESSSAWFPTIDKPNQKTTSEISMTVAAKYTTLSNGKLIAQKTNKNGTRTDTWKMDLPHSPYLFMMAVGDFKIFKESYNGKEVSYYLEPKYAPYAKQIFGKTPDMMHFYGQLLGVEYPWVKYAQIVARDYVSGAMENTSATLHGESVQKTAREMLDENGESTIAHELFHQWFGDYVTAESWSNLTMNESFATFGEVLWHGHDAGQDAEDRSRYEKLQNYLRSAKKDGISPVLARFHYKNRDDMFDNISYSKGAIILYALKNQMGDAAFFKSLNRYLTTNALKNGETHQLRLAMEEVTGKDWSPYFNQWYYQGGNPILNIVYGYANGQATIDVKQIQDSSLQTFSLPLKVALYVNGTTIRKNILIDKREQHFSFDVAAQPDLIDVDVDKILVGQIIDNKKIADYRYQYKNAPSYYNRMEAIKFAAKDKSHDGQLILLAGLADQQDDLRALSIKEIDLGDRQIKDAALKSVLNIAQYDKNTTARAAAIMKLAATGDPAYKELMQESVKDRSYKVIAAGIIGMKKLAPEQADKVIATLDADTKQHVILLIKKFSDLK